MPPAESSAYASMWLGAPGPTEGASTYRYRLSRLSAASVRANSPACDAAEPSALSSPLGLIAKLVTGAGNPAPVLTTNATRPSFETTTQHGRIPPDETVSIAVTTPDA